MNGLNFQLFGVFQITHQAQETVPIGLQPAAQSLLAYLLLHRQRPQRREAIATLFWGEHHDDVGARRCFTTLWRLRRDLEGDPAYIKSTANGEISFHLRQEDCLDVALFEAQMTRGLKPRLGEMCAADARDLAAATQLYTGDLLAGIYADWDLVERERLRALHLKGLARLMDYEQQNRAFEPALAWGQRILELDPLHEDAHRNMMQIYAANGQRELALRQYECCRQLLATELNVTPLPETQALYQQITAPAHPVLPSPLLAQPTPESTALQQAAQELAQTLQCLDQLRSQVSQTLQRVTNLLAGR